jgi:hypothetical protein
VMNSSLDREIFNVIAHIKLTSLQAVHHSCASL